MIFFFSSRRRHTRFDCDWSSDVCSSDLAQRLRTQPERAMAALPLYAGQTSDHRWAELARYNTKTDRKSTRLNSSHSQISYAVFCLKKKKQYVSTRLTKPATHDPAAHPRE